MLWYVLQAGIWLAIVGSNVVDHYTDRWAELSGFAILLAFFLTHAIVLAGQAVAGLLRCCRALWRLTRRLLAEWRRRRALRGHLA
jgi:hypothetical protein